MQRASLRAWLAAALLVGVLAPGATAQITQTAPANLVAPIYLDFDTGSPPPVGPVNATNNPYFLAANISDVTIVNMPGLHTASGDTLSSGFAGNCIASVNNQLAIVAPGGAMDNHQAGAGWSFKTLPGTIARQAGLTIVDQVNHDILVETYRNGTLLNSLRLNIAGSFPNPPLVFQDLTGFDEVRFMNPVSNGGWGIDDFTFGDVVTCPGGICPPPPPQEWQRNKAGATLDINGAAQPLSGPLRVEVAVGSLDSLNVTSTNVGLPWDLGITTPQLATPLSGAGIGTAGGQTVNLAITDPSLLFLNGGASLTLATPLPNSPLSLPLSVPFPFEAAAQAVHVDPTELDGFALSAANEYRVIDCDPSSNFDALATGTTLPISWTNGSNGNSNWTVNSGGTSSSNTGPTSAFSVPNYVYCETSGSGGTSTFSFDTCLFDPASIAGFAGTLDFQISAIGASIGTLNIYLVDDMGNVAPTPVFTQSGAIAGQTQGGTEWQAETGHSFLTQLGAVANPSSVALRFEYVAGGTFTGDIALDDIVVQ